MMAQRHNARVLRMVLAALAVAVPSPAVAADFDWRKPSDRVVMDRALKNMGSFCETSFGFTKVAEQTPVVMSNKLEAHLLLEPSADYQLERWASLINRWTTLSKKDKDEAFIDRLSDAIIAAYRDPDSYPRAEKLYFETIMAPMTEAFKACQEGTSSDFLAKNYWSGRGDLTRYEAMVQEQFAGSVERAREEGW